MPGVENNVVDPVKKKELLEKYGKAPFLVNVDSIEPEGGPTTGNTRVLVRGGPFKDMNVIFPKPKCKFGSNDKVVDAQYVTCKAYPSGVEEKEGKHSQRDDFCLQCENTPEVESALIVPFTVSLVGDFSDANTSVPFRFYPPTRVYGIRPRYGPKNGGTFVEVWGENFLNFGENTVCNFGSKSVPAHFISSTYMTCNATSSDVVEKAIPFSISLNGQQNSKDKVEYWYYNWPQVVEVVPNYGPTSGGNRVVLRGNNFLPFDYKEDIDNSNDTFCNFEGIGLVRAYVLNSTKIYCEAPPNYVTPSSIVEVTLNNQEFTDDNVPYFYYKPPLVFDADPREGPTRGGTEVIIFGNKYQTGKNITCKFGSKSVRGTIIDTKQIRCISPQVERPGYVQLTIAYEGEKYTSDPINYLYYDTPEAYDFYPKCGPMTGYTQITVFGKNFIDMGFGKAKCIFNNTFFMNATVMENDIIKCDSPPLPEELGFLNKDASRAPWYNVSITLNGREMVTAESKFSYYVDPSIVQVTPSLGPAKGGTLSKIVGSGFAQEGVCNITVRYGPITQKPSKVSNIEVEVSSPEAEVPGSVVVSVSLNGQQFVRDVTLHFRDEENTFSYYQELFLQDISPKNGPTSGKTKIRVNGIGFNQFKNNKGETKLPQVWVRFRDSNTKTLIAEASLAHEVDAHGFTWRTPGAELGTQAILEFSFNQKDWTQFLQDSLPYSFVYYNAPRVNTLSPQYGQVKAPTQQTVDIIGKYFECPDTDCKDLWVRFGESKNAIFVKGTKISSELIRASIPKYTKPDVLTVEVTMNGQDYTNDNQTYGYFDPFILKVEPRLISTRGSTRVRLIGFGFVNSGSDLQTTLSSSQRGELQCSGSQCLQYATFIDKNTIESPTYPQASVAFKNNSENIRFNPITIEASVTGNQVFTENGLEIWYYENPQVMQLNVYGAATNQEKAIFVQTDFKWSVNDYDRFKRFGNFSCKFTSRDGSRSVATKGRMEFYPIGSVEDNLKPTHIRCNNPTWPQAEDVKLEVSVNGQDYFGDFTFIFYDSLDLYRIAPMAGPNEGKTKVKLFGTGFQSSSTQETFVKWGIVETDHLLKQQVYDYVYQEQDYVYKTLEEGNEVLPAYLKETYNTKKVDQEIKDRARLKTYITQAPRLPNWTKTNGGPMYMSVGENIVLNKTSYTTINDGEVQSVQQESETIYQYSNSKVEYYYYKQPIVKKIEPRIGLTRGGTLIEVSGAWFAYRPEYGVVPHCKIGDKISRAQYYSSVRIVCVTAPNDDINTLYPVQVSLNGVDFVDTGFSFRFFEQPKLNDMQPVSGPENGGTQIYISGERFSNISDPWNFKCRFTSNDRDIPPKYIPAYYMNQTYIMCSSPGGWGRGDSVQVQVTFNGVEYSDNNFTFYYYNLGNAFPRSGPSDGKGGPIKVEGTGFRKESVVYCKLDQDLYEPIEKTSEQIVCPVVSAKQGPSYFGNVDFAVIVDGNWHRFTGGFQYYEQILIDDIFPKMGPSEGNGIVQIFGRNFRSDFQLADIACKIGNSIGKAKVIDSNTMNCTVEEMPLLDEGFSYTVTAALNKYSWGETNDTLSFVPYGIIGISPNAGPYTGNTDILIKGKGFNEDFAEKARCRFGIASDFAIVEGVVQSYDTIICRSPADFKKLPTADLPLSVPIGISFLDDDYQPWTESIHRFRLYKEPQLVSVWPEETAIDRMAEVYVTASEESEFWEPIPTAKGNAGQYGIQCNFGSYGIGMGFYVNQTTIRCLTPSISEDPTNVYRDTVKLTVSLNGQDFDEEASQIEFTFVGTGSSWSFWPQVIATLLIGLLLVAIFVYLSAQNMPEAPVIQSSASRRSKPHVIRDAFDQFTNRGYSSGVLGRPSSSARQDALSRGAGLSRQQ